MENNKKEEFNKLIDSADKKYACYREVELNSWKEVKQIFAKATNQWIFRGQDNSSFELLPSLYRSKVGSSTSAESIFLELFKYSYEYPEIKKCKPITQFEKLCIMQHFGIPTRLLDWTKCPYAASWFAVFPANFNSSAIWAVNKDWCKYHAIKSIKSIEEYRFLPDRVDLSSDEYFKKLFIYNNKVDGPFFVYPFEIPQRFKKIESFKRMNNQQSIFLCAGNDYAGCCDESVFGENLFFKSSPFKEEIQEEREDYIIKFIIKNKLKKEVFNGLKSKGITHSYLLGSLDVYGQHIMRNVRSFIRELRRTSSLKKIKQVFRDDKSWQQLFKDPEQLIFKDNFSLQSLLESELNTSQKMTLIDIWRDLSSY